MKVTNASTGVLIICLISSYMSSSKRDNRGSRPRHCQHRTSDVFSAEAYPEIDRTLRPLELEIDTPKPDRP